MSKIYTRKGDRGSTTLANGKQVKKSSDIIELYGVIDELNVFLGFAAESLCEQTVLSDLLRKIYRIQKELFEVGTILVSGNKFMVNPQYLSTLEMEIDALSERLPILNSFVLPGGGESSSRLHLARAVCRRAERVAFKLMESNDNAEVVGVYLNRLSDWLFTAARTAAFSVNAEELTV